MKKKLTDLCDIQYGYAFDSKLFTNDEGYIPLIRIRDVQRGFSETYYSGKYPVEYVVHPGDLLVGMDGEFNISRWKDRDALLNQRVCKITAKNGTSEEYIRFALSKALKEIEQRTSFVTVKHLSAKELNRLVLDIPCYSSQVHIVGLCSSLERIIEKRKKQLQILDELIKARFVEMFGDPELNPKKWPIETLGDVLSVEPQNGLYKPQSDYVQDGTGIPILRIDAFYDGKVTDLSGLKRLNCTDTERSRYLLVENDIVINRVNSLEYLGKCAWITGLIEPTVFESNMMRFHVDESRINPCYITRLLCSPFIYKQILNRAKKAVNQASINQRDVQNLKILIPPVELQKQYAAFVAQVDKSKSVVKKSLDETQLLFDSLMQKYFG